MNGKYPLIYESLLRGYVCLTSVVYIFYQTFYGRVGADNVMDLAFKEIFFLKNVCMIITMDSKCTAF